MFRKRFTLLSAFLYDGHFESPESLTYMSIRDVIQARVDEKRLFHVPLYVPGHSVKRHVFASEEVFDIMDQGAWDTPEKMRRFSQLRGQFDHFTRGGLVSVALDPYNKWKKAFIARTDPVADEVWDIRCIDPKPGIRVLGCFAETGLFVALAYGFRADLGGPGSREWADLINRCKARWRALFDTYQPHRGAEASDYISEEFYLV